MIRLIIDTVYDYKFVKLMIDLFCYRLLSKWVVFCQRATTGRPYDDPSR